jgi:hypothetical protein
MERRPPETFDVTAYVAMMGHLARALKVLGLKRLPRDVTPTLQSYLEAVRRTDTIDADEDEARTD